MPVNPKREDARQRRLREAAMPRIPAAQRRGSSGGTTGGGGGGGGGVAYFALKTVTSTTLQAMRVVRGSDGVWGDDGVLVDVYPMPGRVPLDYDGLQFEGDDYAATTFCPLQGQREGSLWCVNLLVSPYELQLPDGADTGA